MTWERVPLAQLLSESREVQGDRPALEPLTLTEGRGFVLQREKFKKRVALEDTSKYKVVRRGAIAYNPYLLWAGAIAQNNQWDEAVVSPVYPVFLPTERADTRYLWHMLQSPLALAEFDSISFGAIPRRRRAAPDAFLRVRVPLPPLPDQRRIAAILDEADGLRTRALRAMEIRSELVRDEFIRRFASRYLERVPVADLVTNAPGAIRTGPFGSDLLHSEFVDEGIPVLGIDNVVANEFTWAKPRHITASKYETLRRYAVQPGDVLISIMGTVGRCAVAPDDIGVAINTKHLCCISLDRTKCEPRFLQSYFLHHPVARDYLRRASRGAIMDGLNMSIIKALPVALPSVADQRDYLEWSARARSLELESRAAQLDALFASLQHRAFRGEL